MSGTSILVDPGTTGAATAVATDAISGTNYQIVKLDVGAIGATSPFTGTILQVNNIGTMPNFTGGTFNAGTVNVGTIGGKAASGALAVANPIQIAGTDSGGTIYSPLINTAGAGTLSGVGTIPGVGVITTITNLANGTVQNSGTVTGVGVVSNITAGTIQNSGTVTGVGVVSMLSAGTLSNGTINSGTINAGTINSGTINAGTIRNDGRPARNILSFGTTISFGGSAFATLVGSAVVGAGTSLWVNDISIVNNGGTQTAGVVFGSNINGSAVLAKGNFASQAGIQKSFPMPVNAGMTNTDLNAWAAGAGTIDFVVSYFISV